MLRKQYRNHTRPNSSMDCVQWYLLSDLVSEGLLSRHRRPGRATMQDLRNRCFMSKWWLRSMRTLQCRDIQKYFRSWKVSLTQDFCATQCLDLQLPRVLTFCFRFPAASGAPRTLTVPLPPRFSALHAPRDQLRMAPPIAQIIPTVFATRHTMGRIRRNSASSVKCVRRAHVARMGTVPSVKTSKLVLTIHLSWAIGNAAATIGIDC